MNSAAATTMAPPTTAVAMGGLYSKLFHLELSEHLPYVTLGLIIWNLINASILEGAEVFIANEGLIKQLPTPLSVHVYRLVWRQMILFGHNIPDAATCARSCCNKAADCAAPTLALSTPFPA